MPRSTQLTSSFRDPSGFLFTREGVLYRQVNELYRDNYERLLDSGLYQSLVDDHLLIPHEEVSIAAADTQCSYKIIRPEPLSFISYPYEWCFSQLKNAALATLDIQKRALECGLSLKDASAYNIQYHRGQPILIDTLSFERYQEGTPWVAYRQFCQHFLAPLALMAYTDVRLCQLLRIYIDGIPLDLASSLLPFRSRLSFPLLMNLHLHASAQKRYAGRPAQKQVQERQLSRNALVGLLENLKSAVDKLRWRPSGTEWADYYADTNYSDSAEQHKAQLVGGFLQELSLNSVWDLGANTGKYSRLASKLGVPTVAFDIDPGAVERNYLQSRQAEDANILPLVVDLTNPSSDLGWHHQERASLLKRGPADAILALALVHHLAIANNVPLDHLARFFSEAGHWLVIEFVPKSDSQVKRLLATREDIFPGYTQLGFEQAFSDYFKIRIAEPIQESERILYLMESFTEGRSA
jgi:hypothetical protein